MHVADQLFIDSFEAYVDGRPVKASQVLPRWSRLDRFGIVVSEPLGALGATLLIQLAIAQFYEVRPERRSATPVYPEIYLFHVGGPHGDFSNFDFWPPRKEIMIRSGEPIRLLERINETGITRLAVPNGPTGSLETLGAGASTWAEQASARERLISCFAYQPDGNVADGDVRLESSDVRLWENTSATLDPPAAARSLLEAIEDGHAVQMPGHSQTDDLLRWAALVEQRAGEVATPTRSKVSSALTNRRLQSNGVVESYRRLEAREALAHIAGIVS